MALKAMPFDQSSPTLKGAHSVWCVHSVGWWMRGVRNRMRALEGADFMGWADAASGFAFPSGPYPGCLAIRHMRRDQLRRPLAPSPRPDHVRHNRAHLMKSAKCRELPRFSATPRSRPVAPLRVPGPRNQFLESDPPGRWRSNWCCGDMKYNQSYRRVNNQSYLRG